MSDISVAQPIEQQRLLWEEEVPGGARDVMAAGGSGSGGRIVASHCDPRLDVGRAGAETGRP